MREAKDRARAAAQDLMPGAWKLPSSGSSAMFARDFAAAMAKKVRLRVTSERETLLIFPFCGRKSPYTRTEHWCRGFLSLPFSLTKVAVPPLEAPLLVFGTF